MNSTFDNTEDKIYGFINKLKNDERRVMLDNKWRSSPEYRLRHLNNSKEDAKGMIYAKLLGNTYVKSLPLSPAFKNSHQEELEGDMKNFVSKEFAHGDIIAFIENAANNGNAVAKKMVEGTEAILKDKYDKMKWKPENFSDDEMTFKMDDENQKKIDVISRNTELDDVADVIADNVKDTAIAEIVRAKKEKQAMQDLEAELANDPNITSEAAIDMALYRRGYTNKTYNPTLFESMMIGYVKKADGGKIAPYYTYDVMQEYGMDITDEQAIEPSSTEIAFIESVKEFTKHSVMKALKLGNYSAEKINKMTYDYRKG